MDDEADIQADVVKAMEDAKAGRKTKFDVSPEQRALVDEGKRSRDLFLADLHARALQGIGAPSGDFADAYMRAFEREAKK